MMVVFRLVKYGRSCSISQLCLNPKLVGCLFTCCVYSKKKTCRQTRQENYFEADESCLFKVPFSRYRDGRGRACLFKVSFSSDRVGGGVGRQST